MKARGFGKSTSMDSADKKELAESIVGRDTDGDNESGELHHIHIDPLENGVEVSHAYKAKKKTNADFSYNDEKKHAFSNAADALAHVKKHLDRHFGHRV